MTPYYQDELVTIYCGLCDGLLPQLQFNAIVTDPPYGIAHPTNYAARGRGDLAQCTDYAPVHNDDKPFDPSDLLRFKLPTVLWGANYYADKLPPSSGWLVWDKMRPHTLDQSTCELAWTNFVKGVRCFRYLWNGAIRDGEDFLSHPTQKPIALNEWTLRLKWMPDGVIVDPYMGSGSLLVAAIRNGRKAIGIEVSEEYCAIAASRCENEKTQPTLAMLV